MVRPSLVKMALTCLPAEDSDRCRWAAMPALPRPALGSAADYAGIIGVLHGLSALAILR